MHGPRPCPTNRATAPNAPARAVWAPCSYYVLAGYFCCFCRGGVDLAVYTAPAALGPYTLASGSVNPLRANHTTPGAGAWAEFSLPCQQAGTVQVHGVTDQHGEPRVMWYGDAWQQAPDGSKAHDPQWWIPLSFDAAGAIAPMTRVLNWTGGGIEYE